MSRNYLEVKEVFVKGLGWKKEAENLEERKNTTMVSVSYIELDSDGNVHGAGVEDMTIEKYNTIAKSYYMELRTYTEKPRIGARDLVKATLIRFLGGNRKDMKKYVLNGFKEDFAKVVVRYY